LWPINRIEIRLTGCPAGVPLITSCIVEVRSDSLEGTDLPKHRHGDGEKEWKQDIATAYLIITPVSGLEARKAPSAGLMGATNLPDQGTGPKSGTHPAYKDLSTIPGRSLVPIDSNRWSNRPC
jgi:hypothetical protein